MSLQQLFEQGWESVRNQEESIQEAWIESIDWRMLSIHEQAVYRQENNAYPEYWNHAIHAAGEYVIDWCVRHQDWSWMEKILKAENNRREWTVDQKTNREIVKWGTRHREAEMQEYASHSLHSVLAKALIARCSVQGLKVIEKIQQQWKDEKIKYESCFGVLKDNNSHGHLKIPVEFWKISDKEKKWETVEWVLAHKEIEACDVFMEIEPSEKYTRLQEKSVRTEAEEKQWKRLEREHKKEQKQQEEWKNRVRRGARSNAFESLLKQGLTVSPWVLSDPQARQHHEDFLILLIEKGLQSYEMPQECITLAIRGQYPRVMDALWIHRDKLSKGQEDAQWNRWNRGSHWKDVMVNHMTQEGRAQDDSVRDQKREYSKIWGMVMKWIHHHQISPWNTECDGLWDDHVRDETQWTLAVGEWIHHKRKGSKRAEGVDDLKKKRSIEDQVFERWEKEWIERWEQSMEDRIRWFPSQLRGKVGWAHGSLEGDVQWMMTKSVSDKKVMPVAMESDPAGGRSEQLTSKKSSTSKEGSTKKGGVSHNVSSDMEKYWTHWFHWVSLSGLGSLSDIKTGLELQSQYQWPFWDRLWKEYMGKWEHQPELQSVMEMHGLTQRLKLDPILDAQARPQKRL